MPATFGTVVNPTRRLAEYLRTHASNSLARSILVVSTPQHARELRGLSEAFPELQTVGVAVDTVPLGCQRSGFSWMISEAGYTIKDKTPLEVKDEQNWKMSLAALRLTSAATAGFDVSIPAANTLFSTGQSAEMWVSGAKTPFEAIHLEVAEALTPKQAIVPAKPLTPWLELTGVADNMLKTLSGNPAARYLEEAPELQTLPDPAVFAELGDTGALVRVVAGGGGLWSARASMLVLEAPASPKKGERLRFWLGDNALNEDLESQLISTPPNGLTLEVAPVPQTLADTKRFVEYKNDHHIDVFGCGSEHGFLVGDNKHSLVGESLYFA